MSSNQKTLQDRILQACHAFMSADKSRFVRARKMDEKFCQEFEDFIRNEANYEEFLKRGSKESLKQQWEAQNSQNRVSRELNALLQGDKLQQISVNHLIDDMKKVNSAPSCEFTASKDLIVSAGTDVQDFVLSESKRQLKEIMDKPLFSQQHDVILNSFLPKSEKEKGLITRITENDPSLLHVKLEESEELTERKEEHIRCVEEQMYSNGELMQLTEKNSEIFVQRLVNIFVMSELRENLHSFSLSETSLRIQSIALDLRDSLAQNQACVENKNEIEAWIALSFVSHQLKDFLKPCLSLIQLFKTSEHKGREIRLDRVMQKVLSSPDSFPKVSEPAWSKDVHEKVSRRREFDGSAKLMTMMTGLNFESIYNVQPKPKDEWPTALENLFGLVVFLRSIAQYTKKECKNNVMALFQNPFVIDQSPDVYLMLLKLLGQTKTLVTTLSDKQEKEMATYLFDGFGEVMLNNMQALFEAEGAHLKILFARGGHANPNYLQENFYPELLTMLLWRQKSRESNPLTDLSEWQKVLQFDDQDAMKRIYAQSELEKESELCKQHKKYLPQKQIDVDSENTKLIAKLDTQWTEESSEGFQAIVDDAIEFIRHSREQKAASLDTLFREVFKRKIQAEEEPDVEVKKVYDVLAEHLLALLFVSSDTQKSLLSNVVSDLVNKHGVQFKQNSFTSKLLRMMTADSVNILRNIQAVNLTSKPASEQDNFAGWKQNIKKHELHGQDEGHLEYHDWQEMVKQADEKQPPRITEIGIYRYDDYIAGLKIIYEDGNETAHTGENSYDCYDSIQLAKGEYITQIHGRFGAWSDQISITTNKGQSLKKGGNGGDPVEPKYPRNSYVLGVDMRLHDYLTRLDVYYVDLDEICPENPLITLIDESDLLSKGIEKKYMGVLSQDILAKMETVPGAIEKPSSAASTMISTTGRSNLSLPSAMSQQDDEDDLHMQIIHAGRNELLDDFIQILQLLLKESREMVRAQMNIMQQNGMKVTRACFAVIIKLSGLTSKLQSVLLALELREPDFEVDEPAERLNLMKEAAKELESDTPLLLVEWSNAVKMRKWLSDTCQNEKIDPSSEGDKARFEAIMAKVISKAEFMTKLEKSSIYQSMSPQDSIFELTYKIPSYARDDIKDADEVQETLKDEPNLWREHYKNWKSELKKQGTIRSQQQQHSKIRQVGTASIIMCMQHKEISAELLTKIVENNLLNSCNRLAGLEMLKFILSLIRQSSQDASKPNEETMMALRNVAAALNMSLRKPIAKEQENQSASHHYLDRVQGCGPHIETLIRKSFFQIVTEISDYFSHAEEDYMLELLSCLDWSFKARDFENLLDLKVFKLLHSGVPHKVESEEKQAETQNIILANWKFKPFDFMAKELKAITSNLYMGIVSRLAEPEARKIIFNKKDEKATGVGSLSRASSVVNVNTAQALLALEFSTVFREFHEFVLIASKLGHQLSLDSLNTYYESGESEDTIKKMMPKLINDTLAKLVSNQLNKNSKEESKTENSEQKKLKIFDSTRYTEQQMEVLQQLDAGVALTEAQTAIHKEIQSLEEDDEVYGMFDWADKEDNSTESQLKLAKDDPKWIELRQKVVQEYRKHAESNNIARYLNMVEIFVRIATKAPYPLEMLQNVANPYHIKTLIKMLFQVSAGLKLQILRILSTLLRIQVPLSIFDEGVKDLQLNFKTETQVEFQSRFTSMLFQSALQIQSNTWESSFSEESRSGMYDVFVNLARAIALCLKIQCQAQRGKTVAFCEDLSKACMQIGKSELTEAQVTTVMQIMQATCSMPVCGDHVILPSQSKDEKAPDIQELISWQSRQNVFKDLKYAKGCIIVPDFLPDNEIPLAISKEAIETLISHMGESTKEVLSGNISATLEMIYMLKLILLQRNIGKESSQFSFISKQHHRQLVQILAGISAFQPNNQAQQDGELYLTSIQEFALAVQLRDQFEKIQPSGSDSFDKPDENSDQQDNSSIKDQTDKTAPSMEKQPSLDNSAAQQVLDQAQQNMQEEGSRGAFPSTGAPGAESNEQINTIYNEILASEEELIEMVEAMVQVCNFSGCTLLDLLYAMNEALADDKRFIQTEAIVIMYNEQLDKLAASENDDHGQDQEKQFVELVTKKLEKIASIHKPEVFIKELLPKLNIQQAVEQVEVGTQGRCNLMRAKIEDRLFSNESVYTQFSNKNKSLKTVAEFDRKFAEDSEKVSKASSWPLTDLPLREKPLQSDEDILKCSVILVKRFAEKLLFNIFDPIKDSNDSPQEESKSASTHADSQNSSVKEYYNQVFGQISEGLKCYARSTEIFNKSLGVECSWEVSFTDNFKIESNLTSDFNCLRVLDDYAFTRSKLNLNSIASMTNHALEMLNQRILQQGSPEVLQQNYMFVKYLIKALISTVIDDLALKQDQQAQRCSSTMVSALSKKKTKSPTQVNIVERVRLITCSILKSNQPMLIGMFAPDLLNLTLFVSMHQDTYLNQSRLLIEEAFQIVDLFAIDEHLKTYVEMGSWEKIASCSVLARALKALQTRSEDGRRLEDQSLLGLLILDLHSRIQVVQKRADKIKKTKQTKPEVNTEYFIRDYSKEVTQRLASANLETSLINDYLQSDFFADQFKKEFYVPAVNEPLELDLGYPGGVKVEFQVEALEGDDLVQLSQTQFEVKFSNDEQEIKESFKLLFEKDVETKSIQSQSVKVTCTALNLKTNIEAVDHESKFMRQFSSPVKYVLASADKKSTYFVTEKAIHQEGHYGAKDITPKQGPVSLLEQEIVEIANFGDNYIFKTKAGLSFTSYEQEGIKVDKIEDSRVTKEVVKEQIRAYITEDGKLHHQDLFDGLTRASRPNVKSLEILQPERILEHYQEGDKIVDLHIGGTDDKKYAILTVKRNENKLLYSKGFSSVVLDGSRFSDGGENKFYLLPNQNSRSSFEQVFLFDQVAFAVDKKHNLWVLGGKMGSASDEIFPMDLGSQTFQLPKKTQFNHSLRNLLQLPGSTNCRVIDMSYSEKLILIKVEITPQDGQSEELEVSLTESDSKYQLAKVEKKKVFLLENKLWQVQSTEDDGQGDDQPILGQLKMVVRPLVRNLDNISMEMLAAELVSKPEQLEQLKLIERLAKKDDLIVKVYRAMNNWVRAKNGNQPPGSHEFDQMIQQAQSGQNGDAGNPLRCWNEQDTEKEVNLIVKFIANINKSLNFKDDEQLVKTRQKVFNDPLQQDTLLNQRLDQSTMPSSLSLNIGFTHTNLFILSGIQDRLFQRADKQGDHGRGQPSISFDRFKASQFGIEGKIDHGDGDTLFTQLFSQLRQQDPDSYKQYWIKDSSKEKLYEANFQGEGSVDAGGPFRESTENISRELTSSVLPVLTPTENQRHEHGTRRECFVLNHQANTEAELKQIEHFGLIIGYAMRSTQAWNIALHPIVWKEIVGVPLDPEEDLKTSDKFMHNMFQNMREQAASSASDEEFGLKIDNQCFTIDFGLGETEIVPGGSAVAVTKANLDQYIRIASLCVLRKASVQMEHFLSGVYYVVRKSALRCLSWRHAEVRAMGEPFIDIDVLRQYTKNKTSIPAHKMEWFWEVLKEMDEDDKQKYLKFVNGRAKLPANPNLVKKHKITDMGGGDQGVLPQAHTCFNHIELPEYPSKEILREKLLIAIRLCGEIDTD